MARPPHWAHSCAVLAAVLLLSFGLSAVAAADELTAHYDDSALVERSHTIAATLHPGYAELVVRREVFNGGSRAEEAIFAIDLPPGAVAVGLKTRGHGASPVWYPGQLLDSRVAESRYLELTGKGRALLRDPALLYWLTPDSIGLQVFPCLVGASQWVEYTLLVPTRYVDGRHQLDVTALGTTTLHATWSIRPSHARDHLESGPFSLTPGAALTLTPTKETTVVELVSEPTAPLTAEFGSIDLGSGRSIVRGAWRAAPRISTVLDDARIVVLLDASRSMDANVFALYRQTLSATLGHFPRAQIALVAFDRVARRITPSFTSASLALEALETWPHETMNGSHVDAALREAELLFQGVPVDKRRLLVLTDTEVRSSLTASALDASILASGALTHWSTLDVESPSLSRAETRRAGAAVERTGGVEWNASVTASATKSELRALFEEWARPLRYWVNRVEIGERTLDHSDFDLREGTSVEFDEMRPDHPREMILHAHLWGSPLELRATTNTEVERRHAAWIAPLGFRDVHELTQDEARHLAFFSRAVTSFTSYLAVEPGVRPSKDGIEREETGLGLSGIGEGGGSVGCYVRGSPRSFDAPTWWKKNLSEVRRACAAEAHALTLGVETTGREVVDVTRVDVVPPDASIQRCLTDALWSAELPQESSYDERRHLQFVL